MAEIVNISPLNPFTFEFQEYSTSDTSLITSFNVDTTFNPQVDYLEYFIYDLNGNILTQNVSGYPGYKLIDNNIVIDPEADLKAYGYNEGQYNTLYNFLSPKLNSNSFNPYFISEISSDRTEVRLDTTSIPNNLVISSSLELINNINTSVGSYYDFYLNFGNNDLVIAVNALLDTTDPNNPTVLIKLYEPLPQLFDINSQCWVVTQISSPVSYNINIIQTFDVLDNNINLKGPNYNLDVLDTINNSTAYSNYNNLTSPSGSYSQGTGSLQYQLNSLLVQPGININIDYSDYSNFIHFSNAKVRLENFYYKLSQLEQYNYNASFSDNASSGSYYVSSSNIVWQAKINEIITTFDDYEYFLYFDSGSACWPKANSTPPYINASTGSVAAQTWFSSQLLVAEEYDLENNNALILTIPSYITEDSNNDQFILFVEMIGQLFDNIFVYLQNVTTKFDADNRLTYGVSKDLVADILRDLGVTIYQNNFSSNDLYQALLGLTPSGDLYNLPYTTTQFPVPTGSGLEYITTYITASSTSSLYPTDDINKEQYKRIYHNLPLLLKKKGSVAGLRDLITTFGIPDTILRINEFGGKDKNSNTYDNWQDEYNYAFYNSGSSYVSSSFVLNSSWGATSNNPQAVELRFKTNTLPANTASVSNVTIFDAVGGITDRSILKLRYTGSGYSSGSYSGSTIDPYYQYAVLEFVPDDFSNPSVSASVYLPFYNEGWWSVLINTSGSTGFTLYAANKNYNGEDGNVISFQASSSVTVTQTPWNDTTVAYFGAVASPVAPSFSGSFQEIRYYATPITKDNFDAYVMDPYSIESSEYLAFRASLGGELYTGSKSIHPKVTGSWVTTSSFASNSNFHISGNYAWVPNTEVFYYDQVPAGIQNAISNKIKQQNIVLPYSSSDSNIPDANVLSPFRSVQQQLSVSSSYTKDIDYVEIAFSPQNEINEDINSQLGYFNLGDVIGDPRFASSSAESYPDLNAIRDRYFEKYTSNYQEWDYIRLIEFFDNSLFKMLQDFVPARTSLAAGIVIKNTLLDRNRYRTPQVNISASLANVGSGSTNIPYIVEDQTITGSIEVGNIEGGNGGSMPELFGQTASVFTYPGAVNITQSWSGFTPSLLGPVGFTETSQTEFFEGNLSGSNLLVTNGNLSDCVVTLQQVYSTSSITLNGDSGPLEFFIPSQYLNVDKTYYFTFTATADAGNSYAGKIYLNQLNPLKTFYTSSNISAGSSLTVDNLEINNPLNPLQFFIQEVLSPGDTFIFTLNLSIYESYIDSDCLVVQNDAQIERLNSKYMDVDFTTNPNIAVNKQAILSGSAPRAAVPDSYYTTNRITNPRYNGCKTISPTGSMFEGFVNQPMTTGSSIGALANVEQYCDWFAYFDSIQDTDYIVSASNYPGKAVHIVSLINISGSKIGLDPNNNIPLSGSNTPNPLTSNIPFVQTLFPPTPFNNWYSSSVASKCSIKQFITTSGSVISGSLNPQIVLNSGYSPDLSAPNNYLFPNETVVVLQTPLTGSILNTNTPGVLIPQNFNPKYAKDILQIAQNAGFFKNI